MEPGRAAAKFVWPPRDAGPGEPAAAQAQFQDGAPAAGAGDLLAEGKRLSGWLDAVEETWLGRTTGPPAQRLAAAGWTPDEPWAYCPRCATSVGPHEADDTGCPACRARRLAWERAVRLGDYAGVLRDLILEVKFTRWRRVGDELGRMLGRVVTEALGDAGVDLGRAVLVPVPMALRTRLIRGVDHALVIARGVSRVTGMPIVRALRRRYRPTQRSVPRSRRAVNVAGAFRATGRVGGLADRTAVVVDDVRTTGATLTAACRALSAAFRAMALGARPRLWTAVLGVTPEPGRRSRGVREGGGGGVVP